MLRQQTADALGALFVLASAPDHRDLDGHGRSLRRATPESRRSQSERDEGDADDDRGVAR